MGAFKIDNPLIVMMIKAANMMIVSFFWLVCCIPLVTAIPACTALYHTTAKVINGPGNGTGVVRDFFRAFRENLRQGAGLSVICLVSGLLLFLAYNAGRQMWDKSFFWALYFAVGFLFAFVWLSMVIWIPPALSRFEASVTVILRLALYFASRNLLRMLLMAALLALTVFLADFYPILALILPGLYADLIRGGVEKTMDKYARENGLTEENQEEDTAGESSAEPMTSLEFDRLYSRDPQEGEEERK